MEEIKISEREKKVLEYISEDEESAFYMKAIAAKTGLEIPQVRRAVRSLARKGLAEYVRGLFDDDGMVAGSGYMATWKGAMQVRACKTCERVLAIMDTKECMACWEANNKHENLS